MKKKPFIGDAMAFLGLPGESPKIEEGLALDLAHVTCAPPVGPCMGSRFLMTKAIQRFKTKLIQEGEDKVMIVEKAGDLTFEDGRLRVVLGLQNLPADMDNRGMQQLYQMGIRVTALAYNEANRFGSGCLNLGVGLSDAGRGVLQRMEDYGFILDLAHASHRMAREALEWIDRRNLDVNVMASHGGCYSVYPHIFNLPDDVLRAIAQRNGVVGIANLTFILSQEDNGAFPVLEHLNHAIDICGKERVVMGSAAPYGTFAKEEEQAAYIRMRTMLDPLGTLGAREPSHASISEDVANEFGATDGILGENLLNFFRRSLLDG